MPFRLYRWANAGTNIPEPFRGRQRIRLRLDYLQSWTGKSCLPYAHGDSNLQLGSFRRNIDDFTARVTIRLMPEWGLCSASKVHKMVHRYKLSSKPCRFTFRTNTYSANNCSYKKYTPGPWGVSRENSPGNCS